MGLNYFNRYSTTARLHYQHDDAYKLVGLRDDNLSFVREKENWETIAADHATFWY